MKNNGGADRSSFRRGVGAGIGVLTACLPAIRNLVPEEVMGRLVIFAGKEKAVIGAMKDGGPESFAALDTVCNLIGRRNFGKPAWNRINFSFSLAVPESIAGKKLESIVVEPEAGRAIISFPSQSGVPTTQRWEDGDKVFSTPSFWRIELVLSHGSARAKAEFYGYYHNAGSGGRANGEWKPKCSGKAGRPIVKHFNLAEDSGISDLVRTTGVSAGEIRKKIAGALEALRATSP